VPARSDAALLAAVAAVIVVVDQVTKAVVSAALGPLAPDSRIDIAGRWLAIEYAENRGAAFGLFGAISSYLPLVGIALVSALLIHFGSESNPSLVETLAVGAITGGAIGNLIDRFRMGFVVDFIAIGAWPNFNVADSAVTVGVLALILNWARQSGRQGSPRPG
jgi:signal peptidase II